MRSQLRILPSGSCITLTRSALSRHTPRKLIKKSRSWLTCNV